MQENYDVHLCSVFWKKEEEYLELEWDMNDHYILTQHIMVIQTCSILIALFYYKIKVHM